MKTINDKQSNEKEELMKRAFHLMLQLNESQLTLTQGVMTGMILEHSLKENEKGKVS